MGTALHLFSWLSPQIGEGLAGIKKDPREGALVELNNPKN